MKLINIQTVAKQYQRGFYALRDLSFFIEDGSFVSIVGPFGCGKSTLLELVAGIREEYSGTIEIKGQNPKQARLNRRIGYVFQKSTLLPWRNVIKNVMLPQEIRGLKGDEDKQKAFDLLEMVGLSRLAHKMPYELSGGMQQLVSIIRSLVLDPDILLLDEPFSSIDEINRMRMHNHLLRIHRQTNKTIILVTHSLHEAVYLSDKVIVFTSSPGRVKKVIDINLYKRDADVIFSEEFLNYIKAIRGELVNEN